MKIIVVGAGEAGKVLVNYLSSEHEIVLVEKEEDLAKEVANQLDALVIHGDATELDILNDAGLEKAQALVAVTGDDKTNLMVCEIAKTFEDKMIISRVNSVKNEELFHRLGIDSVIPVTELVVRKVKNALAGIKQEHVIATIGGDIQIVSLTVEKGSHVVGRKPVIKDVVVGAIYRKGKFLMPNTKVKVMEKDVLTLVVHSKDFNRVNKLVSGK